LQKAPVRRCRSFRELHDLVESRIGDIGGIGELAIYDTALRIGAFLRLEPDLVYLHRGTRAGAKALGVPHRGATLTLGQLPAALCRLSPRELEDCLCIFKDELRRLSRA